MAAANNAGNGAGNNADNNADNNKDKRHPAAHPPPGHSRRWSAAGMSGTGDPVKTAPFPAPIGGTDLFSPVFVR